MPSNPFGVTLRMRVVGSPLLPVDPVRLRQALGNVSLEVADTATGSGGQTPRGSRDTGGSGLGLAIVAQIARHDFFSPYAAVRGYFVAWAMQRRGMSEAEAEAWAARRLPVMLGLGQGFILQAALKSDFDREQYLEVAGDLLAG